MTASLEQAYRDGLLQGRREAADEIVQLREQLYMLKRALRTESLKLAHERARRRKAMVRVDALIREGCPCST